MVFRDGLWVLGFTGSQHGANQEQMEAVWSLVHGRTLTIAEFHHGDCVGADEQIHDLLAITMREVIHPPSDSKKRAFCQGAELMWEPKPYLARNHDIVDACDVLIALPSGVDEQLRSGTWATVRYARKVGKELIIIYPNGRWEAECASSKESFILRRPV
jgi:hypothetical protein